MDIDEGVPAASAMTGPAAPATAAVAAQRFVYVLQLVDGKWYVGCTTNVNARMRAHDQGYAAGWTRRFTRASGSR